MNDHSALDSSSGPGSTEEGLPPLTPATIQRAKEGLNIARDRAAQSAIREALDSTAAITVGNITPKVSGSVRRFVLRALIRTLFRVKVEYPERFPQGAAVLAANHLNHIDPFVLLSHIPPSPYYYILGDARTLYNTGWKRQLLRLAGGVIPLQRLWKEEMAVMDGSKADRTDLLDLAEAIAQEVPAGNPIQTLRHINRTIETILAAEGGILLFAEGRLGTTEGKLHLPLRHGAVTYALKAGVPIAPVALIGTHNLYLRKEIIIRFGEPLSFPKSERLARQDVNAALDALKHSLSALLPEDYQEPEGPKLLQNFLNRMLC